MGSEELWEGSFLDGEALAKSTFVRPQRLAWALGKKIAISETYSLALRRELVEESASVNQILSNPNRPDKPQGRKSSSSSERSSRPFPDASKPEKENLGGRRSGERIQRHTEDPKRNKLE